MRKLLIALALAGAWEIAGAQAIYKYATPQGNVVYTDDPAAGRNGARKLEIAALSPRLYETEYWQRQRALRQGLLLARTRLAQAQTVAQR